MDLCFISFVLLCIVYLPLLLRSYLVWVCRFGCSFVIGFWLFGFVDGNFVGLLFVYGLVTWLCGFLCGFVWFLMGWLVFLLSLGYLLFVI